MLLLGGSSNSRGGHTTTLQTGQTGPCQIAVTMLPIFILFPPLYKARDGVAKWPFRFLPRMRTPGWKGVSRLFFITILYALCSYLG